MKQWLNNKLNQILPVQTITETFEDRDIKVYSTTKQWFKPADRQLIKSSKEMWKDGVLRVRLGVW